MWNVLSVLYPADGRKSGHPKWNVKQCKGVADVVAPFFYVQWTMSIRWCKAKTAKS